MIMEYVAIALFGLACWGIGVRMGSDYVAKRIVEEMSK
jgi:hypothetical protein